MQHELIHHRGEVFKGTLNMDQAMQNVQQDINLSKIPSHHTKRKMRKRRQDVERLKRQQKLQQQKKLIWS